MITTRRHPVNFYLRLAFFVLIILFALLLTVIMLVIVSKGETIALIGVIAFLVLFILVYLQLRSLIKKASIITVDDHTITFGRTSYNLDDIEVAALTTKVPSDAVLDYFAEAAVLEFKNGEGRFLYDQVYENLWQVKSFLYKKLIEERQFPPCQAESTIVEDTGVHQKEEFKGSILTNWSFLITAAFFVSTMALYLITDQLPVLALFLILLGTAFFLLLTVKDSYYFYLDSGRLIVRQHILFWRQKHYSFDDIFELVVDSSFKGTRGLRVITKDFRAKRYPAQTLKNKTWQRLIDRLVEIDIPVRDEVFFSQETDEG